MSERLSQTGRPTIDLLVQRQLLRRPGLRLVFQFDMLRKGLVLHPVLRFLLRRTSFGMFDKSGALLCTVLL